MSDLTIGGIDFRTPGTGYLVTDKVTRKLDHKLIVRSNPYALMDNQVANVFNDIVEWQLPIRISGAGATNALAASDMAAKIVALNAVLTAPNGSYQFIDSLDYDGAPETSYEILTSDPILAQRESGDVERRHVYDTTITLRTSPFGTAGEAINLAPGSVTWVAMLTLSDVNLEGDLPAPLTVSLDCGEGYAKNVVLAICPAGASLADYSTVLDIAHGPGQAYQRTVDIAGRFRVLAYVESESSGTVIGMGQDDSTQAYQQTPIANAITRLYDLGEFDSDGGTVIKVYVCAGSAHLYHLFIVPVDVSCVSAWDMLDPAVVTFGANANSHPGQTVGNGLTCPLDSPCLLAIVDPPTTTAVVSVTYAPLVWGWKP